MKFLLSYFHQIPFPMDFDQHSSGSQKKMLKSKETYLHWAISTIADAEGSSEKYCKLINTGPLVSVHFCKQTF